jgi:hypothetical protein
MLDAWVKTGMVPPFAMATATWGTSACVPTGTEGPDGDPTCTDALDNDCDGAVDGDDTDCGTMTCADYVDKGACNNDTACEWTGSPKSGSCQDAVVCVPTSPDEVGLCGDGIDNDCNGQIDCADASCDTDSLCTVECSGYTTRSDCNAQPACSWSGKNKVCQSI